jgi:hypothetical protein
MKGKSKAVFKKCIAIEKCNKAAYKNKNHYLSLLNYEIYEALRSKHVLLRCIQVHVHDRP